MKKTTSFGTLEVLVERDSKVISEILFFEKEGRGHLHDQWEICYITYGSGKIVNGDDIVEVSKGDVCKIAPGNVHWMIPCDQMEVLIVYSDVE